MKKHCIRQKNRSRQDPLNFPIKLNDKLSGLANISDWGEWKPTNQAVAVRDEIFQLIDAEISKWNSLKSNEIKNLNKMVREKQVDAVSFE